MAESSTTESSRLELVSQVSSVRIAKTRNHTNSEINFTYIFCGPCSGVPLVTRICISLVVNFCGGGEPSTLAGICSLVGLGFWMNSCGMIKFFGRLGDLGRSPSGVGGTISISIPGGSTGRFGIGRSNAGVFLFGNRGWFLWLSSHTIRVISSELCSFKSCEIELRINYRKQVMILQGWKILCCAYYIFGSHTLIVVTNVSALVEWRRRWWVGIMRELLWPRQYRCQCRWRYRRW